MARCRVCWQEGHNRRTCPTLTKRMKDRADRLIEQGFPDHYLVKEYQERIAPKGKKISQQTCGYCQEKGHTRRTCEVLAADKQWFASYHNEKVKVAYEYFNAMPFGIGSLFQGMREQYNGTKNAWENVRSTCVMTNFYIRKNVGTHSMQIHGILKDFASGTQYEINLREYVKNPDYAGSWSAPYKLVAPCKEPVPSTWLSENVISLADCDKHPYFVRTGNKNNDTREWDFRRIQQKRDIVEGKHGHYPPSEHQIEVAKTYLRELSAEGQRERIFKDFENDQ